MASSPDPSDQTSEAGKQGDQTAITLATLLQIEKDARHASSSEALHFIIVNETRRLLQYDQAVLWKRYPGGKIQIEAISGLTEITQESPYTHWLQKTITSIAAAPEGNQTIIISRDRAKQLRIPDWESHISSQVLWCPLLTTRGEIYGGLWLVRSNNWQSGETALLERLADAYAHAWQALDTRRASSVNSGISHLFREKSRLIALIALLLVLMLPVRQSALAPAEVIPVDPIIVTSPLQGVVSTIHVAPNSPVSRGDLLFSLDDTTISNEHAVALRAAEVAQAEYLLAAQKAFMDEESKSELAMLQSRVSLREAEARYSGELLNQVDIYAARDGIAIYSAENDWLGKPVVTGEKVMTLADPALTEMQLWLPIDDAINLEIGAPVKIFLNTDPANPLEGILRQTSYEPQVTPDGSLAFQLKVRFDPIDSAPRIGLKGTGKIYGERVLLIEYLLRRPFSALRRATGL